MNNAAAPPPTLVYLRESSVLATVRLALSGRRFAILAIEPAVVALAPLLRGFATWARKRPNHVELEEVARFRASLEGDETYYHRTNFYARIETALAETLDFDGSGGHALSRAFQGIAANWAMANLPALLDLKVVGDSRDRAGLTSIGMSHDLRTIFERHFGWSPTALDTGSGWVEQLHNLAMTFGATACALAWLARRLRRGHPAPETVPCAFDYVSDSSNALLLDAVAPDRAAALMVLRSRHDRDDCGASLPGARMVGAWEGHVPLSRLWPALVEFLGEIAWVWRRHRHRDCALYWQMVRLPLERWRWRALFQRFRIARFWARDPYNPAHIVRSQELRRAGAISYGLCHALPTAATVTSVWRHIDFDVTFAFGRSMARYYRDTWPKEMQVLGIGGYRLPDEQTSAMPALPRPADFAVLVVPQSDTDLLVDVARTLAIAYPDRRVYFQVKGNHRNKPAGLAMRARATDGLPNVVDTSENAYSLMQQAWYIISNPSTVVAEAIQLGCRTFVTDPPGYQESNYFRDFPEICIGGADDLLTRIKALESGGTHYPRQEFLTWIGADDTPAYACIRKQFGR